MFKAPLLIAALLIAAQPSAGQTPQSGTSPESLGNAFLRAVRAQDRTALMGLIHSASVASVERARIEGAVDRWLALKVDSSWTARIVATESMRGYDRETRTYALGPIRVVFPVAPEHFLDIEGRRALDGGATLRVEGTRDAIARDGGAWKIVIGEMVRRRRSR